MDCAMTPEGKLVLMRNHELDVDLSRAASAGVPREACDARCGAQPLPDWYHPLVVRFRRYRDAERDATPDSDDSDLQIHIGLPQATSLARSPVRPASSNANLPSAFGP
jgi:hypothetical protein